ncbi:MAG: DUF2244 domain-containing protein [Pseudomonadota bacterium]
MGDFAKTCDLFIFCTDPDPLYTDPMEAHNSSPAPTSPRSKSANANDALSAGAGQDDLVFKARLTPHRSLGPSGFRLLMGVIGIICFVVGLVFTIAGVWPIMGFMGLDVLLIYWAFKSNYKAAQAYEDVEVSRAHVLLSKVSPKGRKVDHHFDQFGTRFETERHEEIGITKMRLTNRAKSVEFGYFLNPADRASFADAFSQAMSAAKR